MCHPLSRRTERGGGSQAAVTPIMSQPAPPSPPPENVPVGATMIVVAFLLVAIMTALAKGTAVSTSAIVFRSRGAFLP
jgi:hypothetical protein